MDEEIISIPQVIHQEDLNFKADKIGIVAPVYGHEVPNMVKDFLRKAHFDTDYFYIVLTYGNRHGGASELAQNFFKEQGIDPSYINVILMIDNYLPVFDMEEQFKIDKHVDEQIKQIKEDIDAGKKMISSVTDEDHRVHQMYLDIVASHPKDMYKKLYVITDSCIGCSICEKICPKENMSKRLFSCKRSKKLLEWTRMHYLYGLYSCLSDQGNSNDNIREESACAISQREHYIM